MKILLLSLMALLLSVSTFATIRRVTNNVGIFSIAGLVYINTSTNSVSNAFAQAYNDAANGDTLYLEPSSIEYRTLVDIEKRLVIIGNGYRISENAGIANPLPYNLTQSILKGTTAGSLINLKLGSENSVLSGLVLTGNLVVTANNIMIERCLFESGISAELNSNNNIFKQNHILNFNLTGNGQNNIISNCILAGIYGFSNWTVTNCTINNISNTTSSTFINSIVINNINNNNNSFANCLKIGGAFPTPGINNNIENITLADVFIIPDPTYIYNGSPNFDKNFRLKVGSPAVGIGIGEVDVGAFGGASPYRLSGIPAIPVITNLFLNTTGSTASGLSGSITIQTNN